MDFYSLKPPHDAFRSKDYSLAVLDEAARIRNLDSVIDENLTPALAVYQGRINVAQHAEGFQRLPTAVPQSGPNRTGPKHLESVCNSEVASGTAKGVPELVYQQEVLARFVTIEGGLLKREYIKLGTAPRRFLTLSLGLDFALKEKQKSDFSAAVLAGVDEDKGTWIIAAEKWRAAWPTTFERVLNLYELWHPHIVLTEEVAFSELCVRELAAAGVPMDAVNPSTDKITRFNPIALRYRHGMITHSATLDQEFEDEILAFPEGQYDDYVDALVYGVTALDRTIRSEWSIHQGSGAQWGGHGILPHERKRTGVMYDIHGNRIEFERMEQPWDDPAWVQPKNEWPELEARNRR